MDDLQYMDWNFTFQMFRSVLNLVINGWPSILTKQELLKAIGTYEGFKPCYKWMTFNTLREAGRRETIEVVLNLVINGWPSILYMRDYYKYYN